MKEPQTLRLEEWLTGFFLTKTAEGLSPNTEREYRHEFVHFSRWCETQHKNNVTTLTTVDLRAFLAWLRSQPNDHRPNQTLSPKIVHNARVALRSYYGWLAEEAGISNPMAAVTAPKVIPPVINPLNKDEVSAILKVCEHTCRAATPS